MSNQIWKLIPSCNGYHEASTDGQIRTVERVIPKVNGRTERRKGFVLSQSTDKDGYKVVSICVNGKQTNKKVHRLIAETFLFNHEQKEAVNHINGIKSDNSVQNLEWVTNAENTKHSVKTGLHAKGERHLNSKPVISILNGERFVSIKEAADKLGLKHSTLKNDVRRGNYKYIIPEGEYSIPIIEMQQMFGE